MAGRFCGPGLWGEGLVRTHPSGEKRWTGDVYPVHDKLTVPLRWRKPRMVFVNSASDLFHESLSDSAIDDVFAVMLICALHERRRGHTFQVLTKRTERMVEWALGDDLADRLARCAGNLMEDGDGWHDLIWNHARRHRAAHPSIWLGVSVENQEYADKRIPLLLGTPAAVRFVSAEPLLGQIDAAKWLRPRLVATAQDSDCRLAGGFASPATINWVIAGCESGPGRRYADTEWFRLLRDQCAAASVPYFLKQIARHIKVVKMPKLDGRQHVDFPTPRQGV